MRERKHILVVRMDEMTPEQKKLKDKLFRMCLNRCNRLKPAQSLVKVEICPPGFAAGSVDTFIEKYTSGWGSTYSQIGIGAERKKMKSFMKKF